MKPPSGKPFVRLRPEPYSSRVRSEIKKNKTLKKQDSVLTALYLFIQFVVRNFVFGIIVSFIQHDPLKTFSISSAMAETFQASQSCQEN
jgi:hypothetical protein